MTPSPYEMGIQYHFSWLTHHILWHHSSRYDSITWSSVQQCGTTVMNCVEILQITFFFKCDVTHYITLHPICLLERLFKPHHLFSHFSVCYVTNINSKSMLSTFISLSYFISVTGNILFNKSSFKFKIYCEDLSILCLRFKLIHCHTMNMLPC